MSPSYPPERAHPGRTPFPLYGKILLCLLLNLLLVAVVAGWLLRAHFGVDQNWLLNEAARGRLQAMSLVLLNELRQLPTDDWDAVVDRTGETHRVQLALFDPSGRQVAGADLLLPDNVTQRIQRPRPATSPAARQRQLRRGEDGLREFGPSPPRGRSPEDQPLEANETPWESSFPKEAFRTQDPRQYWFLVRLPYPNRPPLFVVGTTKALGETGLLFNPAPWLWAAAGLVGFSVLLWFPLARSVTGSISHMTRATEEIALGRFQTRVDDTRRDELGRLGSAINQMTLRLQGFVDGQKRFMGDAAHELCSPLARMEVGLAILGQRVPPGERERLEDVGEEVREMRALVNELLAFSRAGLQTASAPRVPVALEPLVREVVEREGAALPVTVQFPPNLKVLAVPALLQRAVANILRNAARHAGANSPIAITATLDNDTVSLMIADQGPGVIPEALPRLFDPFFRVDSSRDRETGGVGLGLAIVKSCVETCGGKVLARNHPAGGFVVELRLTRA
jgi:two-component system sensor histidine kinase CpxA